MREQLVLRCSNAARMTVEIDNMRAGTETGQTESRSRAHNGIVLALARFFIARGPYDEVRQSVGDRRGGVPPNNTPMAELGASTTN